MADNAEALTPLLARGSIMGDNWRAADITTLLGEQYGNMNRNAKMLTEAAREFYADIANDEQSRAASDFYKEVDGLRRTVETTRVGEKETFLEGGRKVDAFFHALKAPLGDACEKIGARITSYLRAKEDAERRRLQAAAEKQRAEEQRLRDEEDARLRLAQEEEERAANARKPERRDTAATLASGHRAAAA